MMKWNKKNFMNVKANDISQLDEEYMDGNFYAEDADDFDM